MGIQCINYKCYISTQHKYLRKGPWNNTTTSGVRAVPTDSVQWAQTALGRVQQRGLSCNQIILNNAVYKRPIVMFTRTHHLTPF